MKILKKVKIWIYGIGIFAIIFPTKVFAKVFDAPQALYGVPSPNKSPLSQYNYPKTDSKQAMNTIETIWKISKFFIIPLVIIIGIIIYFKKKYNKREKDK